jgi:hypothetical protein
VIGNCLSIRRAGDLFLGAPQGSGQGGSSGLGSGQGALDRAAPPLLVPRQRRCSDGLGVLGGVKVYCLSACLRQRVLERVSHRREVSHYQDVATRGAS